MTFSEDCERIWEYVSAHWLIQPDKAEFIRYLRIIRMMEGVPLSLMEEAMRLSRSEETFSQVLTQLLKKSGASVLHKRMERKQQIKQQLSKGKFYGKGR